MSRVASSLVLFLFLSSALWACGGASSASAPPETPEELEAPLAWVTVESDELGFAIEMPSPAPAVVEPTTDESGTWTNHSYTSRPVEGLAFQLTVKDYAAYALPADLSPDTIHRAMCEGVAQSLRAESPRFEPEGAAANAGFTCEIDAPDGTHLLARSVWAPSKRLYFAAAACATPMCTLRSTDISRFLRSLRAGDGTVLGER